ncbi:MAG: GatB/YqeY domain-containing protein [Planctomycetota bacterium]|nr:GatB/YqeY domain-containing protein [Planctomycetota bacterium]
MSLQATLEADLKDAMRAGETLKRDTLRMVISALKNKRIELGEDLDDAAQLAVLMTAGKMRRESAQQFDEAARPELADKERSELAVIEAYLPKQLGEDEVRDLVQAKITELGVSSRKDMGQVMKAVMAAHKGSVDGKLVQRLAGELLS